jgi:hypothetical protein
MVFLPSRFLKWPDVSFKFRCIYNKGAVKLCVVVLIVFVNLVLGK